MATPVVRHLIEPTTDTCLRCGLSAEAIERNGLEECPQLELQFDEDGIPTGYEIRQPSDADG